MVSIFIVYGGEEGEKIGRQVEIYFKGNNIRAFLASPRSEEIDPSEKFVERIDTELKHANIAIIIVTDGIHQSDPALDEINRIQEELKYPFIPFVKNNVTPPEKLEGLWKVPFQNEKLSESDLIQLELKMWRYYDRWQTMQSKVVNESDEIPVKRYVGFK